MRKILAGAAIAVLSVLSLANAARAETDPVGPVHVHAQPYDVDGDGGSWAYSLDYGDYHPYGAHIYATTPSKDARTLRSLQWGSVVIFDQQACCAYRVIAEDAAVYPWTNVGEENAVIQVRDQDGAILTSLIANAVPYPRSSPQPADFSTHLRVFASMSPDGPGSHAYVAGDHVLAKGPSRAAHKVRSLEVGDTVVLGGVLEGTYAVEALYPGAETGEGVVKLYAMTPRSMSAYRLVPTQS